MDRKIFVFWSGNNQMTYTRNINYQSIMDKSGCDVKLITVDNISDYIIEPFHEAYKYLSVFHRCDYWKAYFAYFHGCGYSDIKECGFNWNPYFDQLENSSGSELISYSESGGGGIALRCHCEARKKSIQECKYLIENSDVIPGVCHYIFKKGGTIAKKWREIQHKILDDNMDILINNPGTYHIGAVKGGVHWRYNCRETEQFKNSKYPFCWSELGGMIYHETCYDNKEKCLVTMPKPICGNHWR